MPQFAPEKSLREKPSLLPSLLVLPLTLALFYFLPQYLGKTSGYLTSFALYWLFCLLHGLRLKGENLASLYRLPPLNRTNVLLGLLCFLPAVGAGVASFSQAYRHLSPELYLLLTAAALVNGSVEEFYWRGAFVSRFRQDLLRAFLLPTVLFGLWHISVYAAYGIEYQGGFAPLVGGAFFMGLIWGYAAYRQQRVLLPTIAHILTNFLAFSNLIVENWL